MTAAQLRMARAALDLTVEALAAEAAVAPADIEAIETGGGQPDVAAKLHGFFETAGVAFIASNGVSFDEAAGQSAKTVPLDALNSANDE